MRDELMVGLLHHETSLLGLPIIGLLGVAGLLGAAERNIIFFITDDEGPTLGCYGDPIAVTPKVDRLAADGTLFAMPNGHQRSTFG